MTQKTNLIIDLTTTFSSEIVRWCKKQEHSDIANQFLRAATSVAANVREAEFGESKVDFIHKLKISRKEANESLYWIEMLEVEGSLTEQKAQNLRKQCYSIINVLSKIIITATKNINRP